MVKSRHIFLALSIVLALILLTVHAIADGQNDAEDNPPEDNETMEYIVIDLAKESFEINDTLEGTLNLHLDKYFDPDEKIKVRASSVFKSITSEMTLEEALAKAGKTFILSEEKKTLGDRSDSISLSFLDHGDQSVAVKIPLYANVESVDMSISAPAESTLRDVKLDIGEDGDIDWYYLGDFIDWQDGYAEPEDLAEPPSEVSIIKNSNTYFCQIIDFPHSINYNFFAHYKKENSGGDIRAKVLRLFDGDAENPQDTDLECDLAEQDDYGWGSCTIDTEYGLSGEQLLCIYSATGEHDDGLYRIKVDSGLTESAYTCSKSDDSFSCQSAALYDFMLKLKGAEYSKILNNEIDFLQWQYSPDSILWSFWEIVGSTRPVAQMDFTPRCDDIECLIELKFTANGSGQLTLSSLDIDYTAGEVSGETTALYRMEIIPPMITHVSIVNDLTDLNDTGMTVELPLSIFNITISSAFAPATAGSKVKVTFDDNEEEQSFDVLKAGETIGSEKALNDAEEAIDELLAETGDKALALKILGMDVILASGKTEIAGYRTRLASGDSGQLQGEISSFTETLPKEIEIESTMVDFQYIEPDDITSDVVSAGMKQDTYFLQQDVQVKVSISAFVTTDFTGTKTRYALVKKEVTAKAPISKVNVHEVISKSIADSVGEITFEIPYDNVVKDDPIVKWFLASLSTGARKEYNYVVKTEFAVPITSVKTILVATGNAGGENIPDEPAHECGDGICTNILEDELTCPADCEQPKSPLMTVIIIIIIFLMLVSYVLFYKGKYSIQTLFSKMPFKSKAELESVKKFISNSRAKKMSDIQVKRKLMNKGWTKNQVDYVFAQSGKAGVKKAEPTKVGIKKAAPQAKADNQHDVGPMQKYIQLALSKGMKKADIEKKLIAKGWESKSVKKELKPVK